MELSPVDERSLGVMRDFVKLDGWCQPDAVGDRLALDRLLIHHVDRLSAFRIVVKGARMA